MTSDNASEGAVGDSSGADHRTLSGQIAAELHAGILRGDFPGGSQLKIMELAARYNTSAMPIREALRQLGSLGLVERAPHRGARVLALSLEDMRETMEARLLLEPSAVERAGRQMSHEDIAHATQALTEMEAHLIAKEPHEARRRHEDFHFTFYRASGSSWLLRLIEMVWHNADRYSFAYPLSRAEQDQSDQEHREILAACIKGDSEEAAEMMRKHIVHTMYRLESVLTQAAGVGLPEMDPER